MVNELRQTCRKLLQDGDVKVVIGYGQSDPEAPAYPIFVFEPDGVDDLVWNEWCFPNLVTYLKRKEVQALGKAAVIVKGCDEKALVVLANESQIDRANLVVIGMACEGVGNPRQCKCLACDVHMPRFADMTVGSVEASANVADNRYAELEAFLAKTPEERLEHWKAELSRCVKCYACRQTCPLCYCEQCIVDKNRPTHIDTSAHLKGNFAWHITRAFHLAGRCIGCDECSRACPAGIDLRLLNLSCAKAAEDAFGYRAGVDREADPVIGSYSLQDKEEFIQ
jgi:ferredoxin